jgi:hypothetical protein
VFLLIDRRGARDRGATQMSVVDQLPPILSE